MKRTEQITVGGKTTQFTYYEELPEILAYVDARGGFHDGTVEAVGHDEESTCVVFRHWDDPEYKVQRLIFTGNVALKMNLDLLVRHLYDIQLEGGEQITAFFDGVGIEVRADRAVLQVQELIT